MSTPIRTICDKVPDLPPLTVTVCSTLTIVCARCGGGLTGEPQAHNGDPMRIHPCPKCEQMTIVAAHGAGVQWEAKAAREARAVQP